MKLTLLGTGSPTPNPDRAGPSQHLQLAGASALVDCGNGAARRMVEAGLRPEDLDVIFITHMHSDHTIDLAHMLLTGWIAYRKKPVKIIGPEYIAEFVKRLLHAFELDIRIRRLEERVGKDIMHVEVQEVGRGEVIQGDGWRCTAIEVEHGYVKPALGFKFEEDRKTVVISGDTGPSEALIEAARGADILVHELMTAMPDRCTKHGPGAENLTVFQRRIAESHTCIHEIGDIAKRAEVGQLVLSHLPPHPDEALVKDLIGREYHGPIDVGRDLLKV